MNNMKSNPATIAWINSEINLMEWLEALENSKNSK